MPVPPETKIAITSPNLTMTILVGPRSNMLSYLSSGYYGSCIRLPRKENRKTFLPHGGLPGRAADGFASLRAGYLSRHKIRLKGREAHFNFCNRVWRKCRVRHAARSTRSSRS